MQKLIETQFFCYPKNKNLSILYTEKKYLKTRLFNALSYQISPKEGFLLRLRKSNFGHLLSVLNTKNAVKLKVPENINLKIAYRNNDKTIFFEFDKNDNPVNVFSENEAGVYEESNFIGYSLIENYTKKEYFKKREFIKYAIDNRWKEILENKTLHGDFTHFNVLLSKEKTLHLIDSKSIENSILFDHFYFYSYYSQCLERCLTTSSNDVSEIKSNLQAIILNTCKIQGIKEKLNAINLKEAIGIDFLERKDRFKEFSNFLLRNEK